MLENLNLTLLSLGSKERVFVNPGTIDDWWDAQAYSRFLCYTVSDS